MNGRSGTMAAKMLLSHSEREKNIQKLLKLKAKFCFLYKSHASVEVSIISAIINMTNRSP